MQPGTRAHPTIRESAQGGFAAVGTRSDASVRCPGPLGLQETLHQKLAGSRARIKAPNHSSQCLLFV